MRILALSLLICPLAAQAGFQTAPKHGPYGTVLVEARDAAGAWRKAGHLNYDFHYQDRSLNLPAEALPGGELRLRFLDNDENQLDSVSLSQAGEILVLRQAKEVKTGEDMLAKLARADHDILEVGHDPVLLRFAKPAAGTDLKLTLNARSASRAGFLGYPFWVRDERGPNQVSFRMQAGDGQALSIQSSILKPSSGHPAAPILGEFKIDSGRLKGQVEFGPDNDPGPDDYVTLLARDEGGQPHEFKVGMQPGLYGHADYVYGPAARWQYMRFHFDLPVADLPRLADGALGLELLAYGTACGSLNNDAVSNPLSRQPASPAAGDMITETVSVSENSGVYAYVAHPISVTCAVVDSGGNTIFSQILTATINSCGGGSVAFSFPSICPGAHVAYFHAIGNPDINPNNGYSSDSFTVTGTCSTPTPTLTPCPTVSPTPTASGSSTATPSCTASSTPSVTPSFSQSPSPSATRSASPSCTVSPTYTNSPPATPTFNATQIALALSYTATFDPSLGRSNGEKTLVGPVPSRAGEPLCMYFSENRVDGNIELYNMVGEKVAQQSISGSSSCFKTQNWAPGIYWARVRVASQDRWQKVVILP